MKAIFAIHQSFKYFTLDGVGVTVDVGLYSIMSVIVYWTNCELLLVYIVLKVTITISTVIGLLCGESCMILTSTVFD